MQSKRLFESLNLEPGSKLAELVAHNACPSVIGNPSGNVDGLHAASRIGGLPDLASEYPLDRSGRPFLFLAQINFADLASINTQSAGQQTNGSADRQPTSTVSASGQPGGLCSADLACQSSDVPRSGLLSIFWNERKDSSNPKDRHSFRIFWSDSIQCSPSNTVPGINSICDPIPLSFTNHWSVPANISEWKNSSAESAITVSSNRIEGIPSASLATPGAAGVAPESIAANGSAGFQPASNAAHSIIDPRQIQEIIDQCTSSISDAICVLFGYGDAEINRKKEIAAFASNGVSWSPARSADSCYSHLVDASGDWIFLLRLKSMPELGFDLGGTKSISLLIHKNDFKENRLDKAWMVY
jgi:hypothetical protein